MCPECIKKDQEKTRLNNEMVEQRIKDGLPLFTKEGPMGIRGQSNYMFPCEHEKSKAYKDNPQIFYGKDPRNSQHFWIECEDGIYRSPTGGKELDERMIRNDYPMFLGIVCNHEGAFKINDNVSYCAYCKILIK